MRPRPGGSWPPAPRPVAHQPAFSLLNRDIEADLLPLCRAEGIAVVPYRVLEGGVLSGKYRAGAPPPPGSRGAEQPGWVPRLADPELAPQLRALERAAAAAGLRLLAYPLRQTLAVAGVASLVIGVTRPEQLEAAVRAVQQEEEVNR